jgi:hypothetical protein
MTSAEQEAPLIALWQQGLEIATSAPRLGMRCHIGERVMNSYLRLMNS